MLFINFSLVLNSIISLKLICMLSDLGLRSSIFQLSDPRVCVLSPVIYSLFTHDCAAKHSFNIIFNEQPLWASLQTIIRLHRKKISKGINQLVLTSLTKTKKMIMD